MSLRCGGSQHRRCNFLQNRFLATMLKSSICAAWHPAVWPVLLLAVLAGWAACTVADVLELGGSAQEPFVQLLFVHMYVQPVCCHCTAFAFLVMALCMHVLPS